MKKPRLKVSFSGGKSSGLMAHLIKQQWSDKYEIVFVFCNTGQEDDRTLTFVDLCDKFFGLNLVWLEAVVHDEWRKASTHRVVTFETATRRSDRAEDYVGDTPFERVMQVYGIPNMDFEPCNRELKLNPMKSYMVSIGWGDYYTAIGIRADEPQRFPKAAVQEKYKLLYPLRDEWPTDKQDVSDFWEDQPFQLGIEEWEGNCVTCWKKTDSKQFRLIASRPEAYNFNRVAEARYGWHGSPCYGVKDESVAPRRFFRNKRTVDQLFAAAASGGVLPNVRMKETRSLAARQRNLDFESGGCGESCEAYPMEIEAWLTTP